MALSFLSGGDGLQVAEHLRGAGATRIAHDGLHLGEDTSELALILHDLDAHPGRHILPHRDRLVRRPGPAGPGHAGRAQPEPVMQQPVTHPEQHG